MVKVLGPPITSLEVRIVRTSAALRSRWWNGGEAKWALMSARPDISAISASGWVSPTVNLS